MSADNFFAFGGHRPPLQSFLSGIPAHQLTLRDHVALDGRVQLRALRARRQSQFTVEREDFEIITVRAGRRTRTAVTWFAEIVLSLHPLCRRAALRNISRLWIDVPD